MKFNSILGTALFMFMQVAVLLVFPASAQSPPETPWHVVKTEHYELYSKSAEEITSAQRDLDFAVGKFRQYFGEAPPLIAVVLFDSPEEEQKYDFSAFEQRRIVHFGWVLKFSGLEAALNARVQSVRAMPDLGVVLMNASEAPGALVVQLLPAATLHEVTKDDVIVGVNHQACASVSEFQKLYVVAAVGEKVELELRRKGQMVVVTFAKPPNVPAHQPTTKPVVTSLARVLSHEAGHMYLRAWLRKRADATAATNNAPPPLDSAIPEWFDETVATLFEDPELQSQRTASLLQFFDQMIPLDQLLAMINPMKASKSDLLQQSHQENPAQALVLKTHTGADALHGNLFYAETLSFGQFVSAKFGPGAIRELAIGVTHGRTVEQVLGDLNHSPIALSEIESIWRQWIRR